MSFLNTKQQMGIAAILMAGSVLLSRLMGLARDKVISWQFGAGSEADIYFAAFVVPDFLNHLLAGGYISITLIPLLSKRFAENEEDGWKFFGTIFSLSTLGISLLTFLAFIGAPSLAKIVAPGFSPEQWERLTVFLRIILPAQVFFLPGACLSALLYIRNEFTVPALMPLIYNGCILLFGVLMPWLGLCEGMEGFCVGVVVGALLGALVLPWHAAKAGGLRWKLGLYHPLLWKFLLMALPLIIGQSVVVLDEQFVRIFGTMAGEGAVSLLSYSRRIMMVPVGVVAQAAGVASFPFLAALAAKGAMREFNGTLQKALSTSLIVALPVTAWMFIAAGPVLGFIFEGGSFGVSQTLAAAPLLALMLLSVPFWVLQQVIGRAFYAREDTLRPAIVGTLATLAVVPAYIYFVPQYGAVAVATLTSLSIALYGVVLCGLWIKREGAAILQGLGMVVIKSVFLTVFPALTAWAVFRYLPLYLPVQALLQSFLVLMVSGLSFVGLYLLMARLFVPSYIHLLLGPFVRRFKKCK